MARNRRTYNPCDDCQYRFTLHNQDHPMCKICEFKDSLNEVGALRDANEHLGVMLSKAKQEWISVDERLPEEGTRVIGYDYESNVRCYFIYSERWWLTEDDGWNTAKGWGVTHWMPIPEPPKTKGE